MTIDLRLGDWRTALADVEEVDVLISDPPYGARTHENQALNSGVSKVWKKPSGGVALPCDRRKIAYTCWTPADVAEFVAAWAPRTRGWICAMTSHDLYQPYRDALEGAGRCVFAPLPIVMPGMSVRLAGDGPSSWTVWLVVARPRSPPYSRWGTLRGAYDVPPTRGNEVVGAKSRVLMEALVRDYSRPGDLVCDPCAGSGTTLLAARAMGRRAIGAELDPKTHAYAARRCARRYTPDMFEAQEVSR